MDKKVRIVATLGISSYDKDTIGRLASAGVDVFRINMSHAQAPDVRRIVNVIRSIERDLKRPIAILGDLQGPKIRLLGVKEGAVLARGAPVRIIKKSVTGSAEQFSVSFPDLLDSLVAGVRVYLGDGEVQLEVISKNASGVEAVVIAGGPIRSRMGFAAHGIALPKFIFTKKDVADLKTVTACAVDAVAVSFIQNHRDILHVKSLLPKKNPPMIVAKIETERALLDIENIINVCDAVMVARGDLGLSMPLSRLPAIQKHIISLCRQASVPVITATQMLESMTANIIPTRAEVTDVANAISDGTDAIMLSGETASGKHPVEAVEVMREIAIHNELHIRHHALQRGTGLEESVAQEAVAVADRIGASVIIAFTASGATARRIASHRPDQKIIAASFYPQTIRKLCFTSGITSAVKNAPLRSLEDLVRQAHLIARSIKNIKLKKGDPYVVVAGIPFGGRAATNMVLVQRMP